MALAIPRAQIEKEILTQIYTMLVFKHCNRQFIFFNQSECLKQAQRQLHLNFFIGLSPFEQFCYIFFSERWNIQSAHPVTLFTQFKTNTKSINIYRVSRHCVLLKNQDIVKFMKWARLTRDQYISINDVHSTYCISLLLLPKKQHHTRRISV